MGQWDNGVDNSTMGGKDNATMRRLGNGHWSSMTLRRSRRVKMGVQEVETMDIGTLDRCVGLMVSMCLAHVLNSCIGQLRNTTNHRLPWQALFGLTFKVVLFCSVFGSRFWQIGSPSTCAASFAFSLLAFGRFFAPLLIKIGGERGSNSRPWYYETYPLPAALSPTCPFARFADVGLQGLDHPGAWQTEFGLTREVCVLLFGFSEACCGKSGRRASVAQDLLSA